MMEYCANGGLDSYVKRKLEETKEAPIASMLQWAVDCVSAVCVLHAKDYIHNDIKPQNYLVTYDGRVKMSDFGLSKYMTHTVTQATGYTLAYCAPEIFTTENVSKKSDLYSLGLVLYFIFTGQEPGGSMKNVKYFIAQRTSGQKPDYKKLPAKIRSEVSTTLDLCLDADPKKRSEAKDVKDHLCKLAKALKITIDS
eukprot:TRINITY_DN941_c1_g2_i1.p1 TRINITY_DN941_c1_g2~~TRINITY_DN941_c1_g2_i1.p1  ORF type:complete len:196 (-),score=20.95 TRINITY_DN941_c1_g2_i1:200-787(-)